MSCLRRKLWADALLKFELFSPMPNDTSVGFDAIGIPISLYSNAGSFAYSQVLLIN